MQEHVIPSTDIECYWQNLCAPVVRWHPLDPLLEALAHFDSQEDLNRRIEELFGVSALLNHVCALF